MLPANQDVGRVSESAMKSALLDSEDMPLGGARAVNCRLMIVQGSEDRPLWFR